MPIVLLLYYMLKEKGVCMWRVEGWGCRETEQQTPLASEAESQCGVHAIHLGNGGALKDGVQWLRAFLGFRLPPSCL